MKNNLTLSSPGAKRRPCRPGLSPGIPPAPRAEKLRTQLLYSVRGRPLLSPSSPFAAEEGSQPHPLRSGPTLNPSSAVKRSLRCRRLCRLPGLPELAGLCSAAFPDKSFPTASSFAPGGFHGLTLTSPRARTGESSPNPCAVRPCPFAPECLRVMSRVLPHLPDPSQGGGLSRAGRPSYIEETPSCFLPLACLRRAARRPRRKAPCPLTPRPCAPHTQAFNPFRPAHGGTSSRHPAHLPSV